MPAPAQPPLPQVRIKSADLTTYLDYIWANDLGGDLLKTANTGPLINGASTGGRWDLAIVPGSISGSTCSIRRKVRAVSSALIEETSHPLDDTVVTGVLLDGTTGYLNTIVPGWQVVFNAVGVGIVDTHTAHITEGDFLGSFPDGNPDAATPGDPVFTRRIALVNEGADIAKNVRLITNRPKIMLWPKANDGGLDYARVVNTSPVPKIVGDVIRPYKASLTANAGDSTLRDLLIDGASPATIIRLSNNTTVDGVGMHRGERYRLVSTGAGGTEIQLTAAGVTGATFNLNYWPPDPTETSIDNSGTVAGWDTDDILIGDLAPAGVGYAWVRVFANIGSGDWNPIQVGVTVSYLKTGVAAIDET